MLKGILENASTYKCTGLASFSFTHSIVLSALCVIIHGDPSGDTISFYLNYISQLPILLSHKRFLSSLVNAVSLSLLSNNIYKMNTILEQMKYFHPHLSQQAMSNRLISYQAARQMKDSTKTFSVGNDCMVAFSCITRLVIVAIMESKICRDVIRQILDTIAMERDGLLK